MENTNSSGNVQFHLRRIGPKPLKPGVANIMDFHRSHYIIGRSVKQADFIIDSNIHEQSLSVSRCHARVAHQTGNHHRLYDDSLNGVYVNHIKITGSCILHEGDRVTFGHPAGDKLLAGSWHRQPNSEHQFVFEKCSCIQTDVTALEDESVREEGSARTCGSMEQENKMKSSINHSLVDTGQKLTADLKDTSELDPSIQDVDPGCADAGKPPDDSAVHTEGKEKVQSCTTTKDAELSLVKSSKNNDQASEREKKSFDETAASIMRDLTVIKNMLLSSPLLTPRKHVMTPKKGTGSSSVTPNNSETTPDTYLDFKYLTLTKPGTTPNTSVTLSNPVILPSKDECHKALSPNYSLLTTRGSVAHPRGSRKRIFSPSKDAVSQTDHDGKEKHSSKKTKQEDKNNPFSLDSIESPCKNASVQTFQSEENLISLNKSTAVQADGIAKDSVIPMLDVCVRDAVETDGIVKDSVIPMLDVCVKDAVQTDGIVKDSVIPMLDVCVRDAVETDGIVKDSVIPMLDVCVKEAVETDGIAKDSVIPMQDACFKDALNTSETTRIQNVANSKSESDFGNDTTEPNMDDCKHNLITCTNIGTEIESANTEVPENKDKDAHVGAEIDVAVKDDTHSGTEVQDLIADTNIHTNINNAFKSTNIIANAQGIRTCTNNYTEMTCAIRNSNSSTDDINSDTEMLNERNDRNVDTTVQGVSNHSISDCGHDKQNLPTGTNNRAGVQSNLIDTYSYPTEQGSITDTDSDTDDAHMVLNGTSTEIESDITEINIDTEEQDVSNDVLSDTGSDIQSVLTDKIPNFELRDLTAANSNMQVQSDPIITNCETDVNNDKNDTNIDTDVQSGLNGIERNTKMDVSYVSLNNSEKVENDESDVRMKTRVVQYDDSDVYTGTRVAQNDGSDINMKTRDEAEDYHTEHNPMDELSPSVLELCSNKTPTTGGLIISTIETDGHNGDLNRLKRSESVEYDVIEMGHHIVNLSDEEENMNDDNLERETEICPDRIHSPANTAIAKASTKEFVNISTDEKLESAIKDSKDKTPGIVDKLSSDGNVNMSLHVNINSLENEVIDTTSENEMPLNHANLIYDDKVVCEKIDDRYTAAEAQLRSFIGTSKVAHVSLTENKDDETKKSKHSDNKVAEIVLSYARDQIQADTKKDETDGQISENFISNRNVIAEAEIEMIRMEKSLDNELTDSVKHISSEQTDCLVNGDADKESETIQLELNEESEIHTVDMVTQCDPQSMLNKKEHDENKINVPEVMIGGKRKLSDSSLDNTPSGSSKVFVRDISENTDVSGSPVNLKVESRTIRKIFKRVVSNFFKMKDNKKRSYKIDSKSTQDSLYLDGKAGIYRNNFFSSSSKSVNKTPLCDLGTEIIYDRKSQLQHKLSSNNLGSEVNNLAGEKMDCNVKKVVPDWIQSDCNSMIQNTGDLDTFFKNKGEPNETTNKTVVESKPKEGFIKKENTPDLDQFATYFSDNEEDSDDEDIINTTWQSISSVKTLEQSEPERSDVDEMCNTSIDRMGLTNIEHNNNTEIIPEIVSSSKKREEATVESAVTPESVYQSENMKQAFLNSDSNTDVNSESICPNEKTETAIVNSFSNAEVIPKSICPNENMEPATVNYSVCCGEVIPESVYTCEKTGSSYVEIVDDADSVPENVYPNEKATLDSDNNADVVPENVYPSNNATVDSDNNADIPENVYPSDNADIIPESVYPSKEATVDSDKNAGIPENVYPCGKVTTDGDNNVDITESVFSSEKVTVERDSSDINPESVYPIEQVSVDSNNSDIISESVYPNEKVTADSDNSDFISESVYPSEKVTADSDNSDIISESVYPSEKVTADSDNSDIISESVYPSEKVTADSDNSDIISESVYPSEKVTADSDNSDIISESVYPSEKVTADSDNADIIPESVYPSEKDTADSDNIADIILDTCSVCTNDKIKPSLGKSDRYTEHNCDLKNEELAKYVKNIVTVNLESDTDDTVIPVSDCSMNTGNGDNRKDLQISSTANDEAMESVAPKGDNDEDTIENSICFTEVEQMKMVERDTDEKAVFPVSVCTSNNFEDFDQADEKNDKKQVKPADTEENIDENNYFEDNITSTVVATAMKGIEPTESEIGTFGQNNPATIEEIEEVMDIIDNVHPTYFEGTEQTKDELRLDIPAKIEATEAANNDCGNLKGNECAGIEISDFGQDFQDGIEEIVDTEACNDLNNNCGNVIKGNLCTSKYKGVKQFGTNIDYVGNEIQSDIDQKKAECDDGQDDTKNNGATVRKEIKPVEAEIDRIKQIKSASIEDTEEPEGENYDYDDDSSGLEIIPTKAETGDIREDYVEENDVNGVKEDSVSNGDALGDDESICSDTSDFAGTTDGSFMQFSQMFPALRSAESEDETRSPVMLQLEKNDTKVYADDQLSCNFSDDDDSSFPCLDMSVLNPRDSENESCVNEDINDDDINYKSVNRYADCENVVSASNNEDDCLFSSDDDLLLLTISDRYPDDFKLNNSTTNGINDREGSQNQSDPSHSGLSQVGSIAPKRKLGLVENSSSKKSRFTHTENADVFEDDNEDAQNIIANMEHADEEVECFTHFKTPTEVMKPADAVIDLTPVVSPGDHMSCTQLVTRSVSPDLDNFTASQVDTVTEQLGRKAIDKTLISETRDRAMALIAKLKTRKAVKKEEIVKVETEDQLVNERVQSVTELDGMQPNQGQNETIDAHVERCKRLISQMKTMLDSNLTLPRIQAWRKELNTIEEKVNFPKTVIAVVGKTGDGKSSLLNALMDQKSVLPTSCMQACTAVVVEVVENTASDQYEADIEFLERKEWFDEVNILLNDLTGLDGKLKTRQPDPSSETYASYCKIKAVYGKIEKYEKLVWHRSVTRWLGKTKCIKSSLPGEFREKVEKFIETQNSGSGDQFWPIVKHVRLRIPNCHVCSSGAALVDLPGVRDSNAARDKIAKEYLKNCTAIWVVSSIHRAIDDKIAKDLLGENFRRQLLMDGLYGSVTFICTKTDILVPSEVIRPLKLEEETKEHMNIIAEAEAEKCDLAQIERNCLREIGELKLSLDDMKADTHELRDNLEEIGSLLDPSDLEKEDSENFTVLQDYQGELKQKESEIVQTETRISELDLAQQDSANKISQRDTKLTVHRRKISVICAHGRNQYSEDRIKSDFKAGLKEMKRRAGLLNDDQEEIDDDDDDDDSVGSRADNLRVFCCSSTEYQKMMHLLDGPPQVFANIEDTQIPELRRYVHQITHVRRQHALERLVHSLGGFVFDLKTYVTECGHADTCKWKKAQSSIEKEIESLGEVLEPVIDQLSSSIDEVFERNIRPKMDRGADTAVQEANATCAKWGSKKVQKKDGNFASFPWVTYKAIVRRQGSYSSPTFGSIDFNMELLEPMYRSMTIVWDRTFSGSLWNILDEVKKELHAKLNEFVLELGKALYVLGMAKDRLKAVGAQFLGSAGNKLEEMVQQLKEIITTRQREISRIITPHIRESLGEVYHLAAEEQGTGTFMRMKQHMTQGIDRGRFIMFDEATNKLLDELMELRRQVVEFVRTFCQSLMEDLRVALEPFWQVEGVSNPYSEEILPALTTVCTEMEDIYTSTGIENTENHSAENNENHSAEITDDQSTEITDDQSAENTVDHSSEDADANSAENTVDHSAEDTDDNSAEDTDDNFAENNEDHSVDVRTSKDLTLHVKKEPSYTCRSLIMPPVQATNCIKEETWTSDSYRSHESFTTLKTRPSYAFFGDNVETNYRTYCDSDDTSAVGTSSQIVQSANRKRKSPSCTQTNTEGTFSTQTNTAETFASQSFTNSAGTFSSKPLTKMNTSISSTQSVVQVKEEPSDGGMSFTTKRRRGRYLGFIDLTLDD